MDRLAAVGRVPAGGAVRRGDAVAARRERRQGARRGASGRSRCGPSTRRPSSRACARSRPSAARRGARTSRRGSPRPATRSCSSPMPGSSSARSAATTRPPCSRRSAAPANGASADAASALASIAIDEERYEDAERLVDDAARDPEQAAGARWQRARIAEERGNNADAARLYQAIDTGPRALGAQLRAHAAAARGGRARDGRAADRRLSR